MTKKPRPDVSRAANGRRWKNPALTSRELECLRFLARGLRSEAIAHELGVKRVTIDLHIANAKRKMNASTREHAVALAVHHRIVTL